MCHEPEVSGNDCVIRMRITADELHFSVYEHRHATAISSVAVCPITSVRSLLRHEPIRASELEAAIAEVEDLIMPIIQKRHAGSVLEVEGDDLNGVIKALPLSSNGTASIEAVENLFSLLARVTMGTPASALGVPVSAQFALGLVFLREVMHHAGIHTVLRAA